MHVSRSFVCTFVPCTATVYYAVFCFGKADLHFFYGRKAVSSVSNSVSDPTTNLDVENFECTIHVGPYNTSCIILKMQFLPITAACITIININI